MCFTGEATPSLGTHEDLAFPYCSQSIIVWKEIWDPWVNPEADPAGSYENKTLVFGER